MSDPCTATGHTIQQEGTPLPQECALNFKGVAVAVADDPGNGSTDVTIVGSTGAFFKNAASTGTTVNRMCKWVGSDASDDTVVITPTGDAGTFNAGLIGVVDAGAGTSGFAHVVLRGEALCDFDGSVVKGDWAILSNSAAGKLHDVGYGHPLSGIIDTGNIIGRIAETGSGAGTYKIDLHPFTWDFGDDADVPTTALRVWGNSIRASEFRFPLNVFQESDSGTSPIAIAGRRGGTGILRMRFGNAVNDITTGADPTGGGGAGASGLDLRLTTKNQISTNDQAVGMDCALYTDPFDYGDVSGSFGSLHLPFSNVIKINLTGDVTMTNAVKPNPGQPLYMVISQDSSGGHALAWYSSFKNAPVVDPTASKAQIHAFLVVDATHFVFLYSSGLYTP